MNETLVSLRIRLAVVRAACTMEVAAGLVSDIFGDGRTFDDVSEEMGMPKAEMANRLLEFSDQIASVSRMILQETGAPRPQ